jgi:hypothetical protein
VLAASKRDRRGAIPDQPDDVVRPVLSVDLGKRYGLGMGAALAAEQGVFNDQGLGAVIAGGSEHAQDERAELRVLLTDTSPTEPADT